MIVLLTKQNINIINNININYAYLKNYLNSINEMIKGCCNHCRALWVACSLDL